MRSEKSCCFQINRFKKELFYLMGPFALFMLCTVLRWLALMHRSYKTESLGFDFMDFPHDRGSLSLPFNDIAALLARL